jgi:uncharacterized membrane protein
MAEKFTVRIENCPQCTLGATPRRPSTRRDSRWALTAPWVLAALVGLPLIGCAGPERGSGVPGAEAMDPLAGSQPVLSQSGEPHTGSAEVLRGQLWFQDWKPVLFQACGSPERIQVALDGGGLMEEEYRKDAPSGSGTYFVEGLGVISEIDGRPLVWIQAVRAIGWEGVGCTMALTAGDLRASGNEPGWSFVFRNGGGRLATIEATRTAALAEPLDRSAGWPVGRDLVFLLDHEVESGEGRPAAGSDDPGASARDTLVVRLSEGPCHDSMSGTRFPFRASVRWTDQARSGCAADGRNPVTTATSTPEPGGDR